MGNFIDRGIAANLAFEMTRCPQVDVELLDDMNGQTDRTRLIHDGTFDRLANPPGGVGREAETTLGIEFFQCMHQADVAFLDQVEQSHAAIDVMLGNVHDEAQIVFDHALPGFEVTLYHPARQGTFFVGSQQSIVADVIEVDLGNVGYFFVGTTAGLFSLCGFLFFVVLVFLEFVYFFIVDTVNVVVAHVGIFPLPVRLRRVRAQSCGM